jgi:hypothetical protein
MGTNIGEVGVRAAAPRRGPSRWQRLGILVLCLDVAIVAMAAGRICGDIDPGVVFAAGGSDVNPVSYLGTKLDQPGCTTHALSVGEGMFVICEDWTAVTTRGGKAQVVSLYAAGNPVVEEYEGTLPEALHWGETMTEVGDQLGEPRRITDMYGTPTLVYMYDTERYGSLELQFDDRYELVRINACLKH